MQLRQITAMSQGANCFSKKNDRNISAKRKQVGRA